MSDNGMKQALADSMIAGNHHAAGDRFKWPTPNSGFSVKDVRSGVAPWEHSEAVLTLEDIEQARDLAAWLAPDRVEPGRPKR